jgi:hypothetical protein
MARIRSIKPEFWSDEKIVELDPVARLFFIGLWNFADDNGNLVKSVKRIKMQVFPADVIDCSELIDSLSTHGLLIEYAVNGEKFLHIKGFRKHQVINRPSKTTLPEPPKNGVLTEHSLTEGKGKEGKGKEGIGGKLGEVVEFLTLSDGSDFAVTSEHVGEFERAYPVLDVRAELKAMRIWCMSNPGKRKTRNGILRFINNWLSKDRQEANGKQQDFMSNVSPAATRKL